MYTTRKAFLDALEKSMLKHSSDRLDKQYDDMLQYGRAIYRGFIDWPETDNIEDEIKGCVACDLGLNERRGVKPHWSLVSIGKLFDVTSEIIASELARWDASFKAVG